jgi:hypothetical protein
MRRILSVVAAVGSGVAVLALAGCSSSSATKPKSTTSYLSLTTAQQRRLDSSVVSQVEASVGSMVNFNVYGSSFGGLAGDVVKYPIARALGALKAVGGRVAPRNVSQCTTETPANPTDTDGDGVPDTATFTYACSSSTSGSSFSLNGSVTFGDPTPTTADIAYQSGIALAVGLSDSSASDSLSVTGATTVSETQGQISQNGNVTLGVDVIRDTSGNTGTASLVTHDTATYAYSGPFLTSVNNPLPAGTFNLTGNWTWTFKTTNLNANLSFAVSTPNGGLSVDPVNCTTNTAGIVSGTVQVTFSGSTVVTAVWAGCPATPTITTS